MASEGNWPCSPIPIISRALPPTHEARRVVLRMADPCPCTGRDSCATGAYGHALTGGFGSPGKGRDPNPGFFLFLDANFSTFVTTQATGSVPLRPRREAPPVAPAST